MTDERVIWVDHDDYLFVKEYISNQNPTAEDAVRYERLVGGRSEAILRWSPPAAGWLSRLRARLRGSA